MSTESTTHLLRPGRSRARTFLLGGVIFVAGMVLGGALTLVLVLNRAHDRMTAPELAGPRIVDRLRGPLDLTDQQAEEIRGILARHQESLVALREDVRPQIEAELTKIRDEINQTLTPEQSRRWQKMTSRLYRRWARWGRPSGPRPGPR
jgi:hypothetical protein